MATIFSHALVAVGITYVIPLPVKPKTLWFAVILSSVVPDFDVISFALGIPYSDVLGHRGLSHSFVFSLVWTLLVYFLLIGFAKISGMRDRLAVFCIIWLSTVSHSLLDAMTNGGLGVALFAPFSNERILFAFRPIAVSPIGTRFFSENGLAVLINEALTIILPMLGLVMPIAIWRFLRKNRLLVAR